MNHSVTSTPEDAAHATRSARRGRAANAFGWVPERWQPLVETRDGREALAGFLNEILAGKWGELVAVVVALACLLAAVFLLVFLVGIIFQLVDIIHFFL